MSIKDRLSRASQSRTDGRGNLIGFLSRAKFEYGTYLQNQADDYREMSFTFALLAPRLICQTGKPDQVRRVAARMQMGAHVIQ